VPFIRDRAVEAEGDMVTRKKWSELSGRSRRLIVVAGVVEVALLMATLIDIKRRPADRIRGSKRMWNALAFVNIIGPVAYFSVGRRRRGTSV
jgi:hypothetical protein